MGWSVVPWDFMPAPGQLSLASRQSLRLNCFEAGPGAQAPDVVPWKPEVAACGLAVGRWQQGAPQPSPLKSGEPPPHPPVLSENLPGTTAHAGSPGAVRPLTTASRCRSLDYERFMQILSQRHLQRGAKWRKAEGYRGSSLTPLQRTGCTFIHPAVRRSIHPPVYAWPADAGSVSVQLSGQRRRQGN